jgi:hypothetical protein
MPDSAEKKGPRVLSFKPLRLRHEPAHFAARLSLRSLIGAAGVTAAEDKDSCDAIIRLLGERRKKIRELRQMGWDPVAKHLPNIFMLNCPPVSLITNHQNVEFRFRLGICSAKITDKSTLWPYSLAPSSRRI